MTEEYKVKNTNTFIDITGQTFNELTALKYLGDRMWEWRCSCGKIVQKRKNDVTNGKVKSCGHLANRGTPNTINVGDIFNEWTVIEVINKRELRCRCSCNREKIVLSYDLKNGKSKSCGHLTKGTGENGKKDLTGQTFGEWTVLRYDDTPKKYGFWVCRCSCGSVQSVRGILLRNGDSKSCGHATNRFQDLTGQKFNEWTAIKYKGNYKWECKCSCGKIKDVWKQDLINGNSTNCGHLRTPQLEGRKFGKITVLKYLGNKYWLGECECGNKTVALAHNLLNGNKKSCGCLAQDKKQAIITNIQYTMSTLMDVSDELPFIEDIAEMTGLTSVTVRKYIAELSLGEYINKSFGSKAERDIYNFINSLTSDIELHNKSILDGKELDLYIPSHNLAIEFNGSYWHSTEKKADIHYHQQKTLACARKGVHLIHIFEYEWNNEAKREKIKQYIKSILRSNNEIIHARNTEINLIEDKQARIFLDSFHLQGYIPASVNLGCFYNDELIGLMTFGKPRFSNNYEYEIIRFCWKDNTIVVGGAAKLFKHFIKNYNPQSIITYADLAKFTGKVYTRLNFKPIQPSFITEPNYVWVSADSKEVLTRYQTMKHKLIEKGLGTPEQTEDEIMQSLDYFKVYDSGNMKLEWIKPATV